LQVRMGCGASSSAVAPKADRPPIKVAPKQPGINELMSPRQMTPRELLEEKCATKVQSMYRGKADRRFTGQMQTERRIAKMTTDAELKRSSTSATLQSVNNYNFIKTLGKGAYGQVYLATTKDEIDPELVAAQPRGWFGSSTQVQVAVKVLSRSILRRKRVGRHGSAYDSVLGEIAVMKQLQHPNIVRLYEVIDDPDEDLLFMVMELVGGGDLSAPVEAKRIVPEPELRLWLRGLVLGLEHLHLCGVCHRDIKPENLLWDASTQQAKLSDFGISGFFRTGSSSQMGQDFFTATGGSLVFFAPEMCRSLRGAGYSGRAADMWACGVSLFMWLYHRPPYEASNPPALLEKISTEEIDYPEDTRSSPELLNLLRGLLQKAPLERLRIRDLRHDAFLTEGGKSPFDTPLPFIMRSSSAKGGEKLVDPSSVAVDLEHLQKAIKCVAAMGRAVDDGDDEADGWQLAPRIKSQEDKGAAAEAAASEAEASVSLKGGPGGEEHESIDRIQAEAVSEEASILQETQAAPPPAAAAAPEEAAPPPLVQEAPGDAPAA